MLLKVDITIMIAVCVHVLAYGAVFIVVLEVTVVISDETVTSTLRFGCSEKKVKKSHGYTILQSGGKAKTSF